jgi:hypothetical protein
VGVAHGFACHRTKPKALIRIETSAFQAAIVECERFGLCVFDKQFTIVRAGKSVRHGSAQLSFIAIEKG